MDHIEIWHLMQHVYAVREAGNEKVRGWMESGTSQVCVVLQEVMSLCYSPTMIFVHLSIVIGIRSRQIFPLEQSTVSADCIDLM